MRLIILSEKFYDEYGQCPEILQKKTRPYVCLEVKIRSSTFAIPFRHHIRHRHAFFTCGECGLDYTKAVVIRDKSYISAECPRVEQAEFNALKGMDSRVRKGLADYIALYKKASRYKENRHYANILQCSALQYFEEYI